MKDVNETEPPTTNGLTETVLGVRQRRHCATGPNFSTVEFLVILGGLHAKLVTSNRVAHLFTKKET